MKIKSLLILFIFSLNQYSCMGNMENYESDSLNYKVRVPKERNTKIPILILLHGYGSNENDLFSLFNQVPDNWLVISVRAPNKISTNSYCWYSVKMENSKIAINAKEEEESRMAILNLIKLLCNTYMVDTSKIVLAGFSQGANLAESTALLNPKTVKGFAVFSGRFLDEIKPKLINPQNLKNTIAFVAHGTEDSMLPISYAQENTKILSQLGIKIEYATDIIGHSISKKELDAFSNWLSQI